MAPAPARGCSARSCGSFAEGACAALRGGRGSCSGGDHDSSSSKLVSVAGNHALDDGDPGATHHCRAAGDNISNGNHHDGSTGEHRTCDVHHLAGAAASDPGTAGRAHIPAAEAHGHGLTAGAHARTRYADARDTHGQAAGSDALAGSARARARSADGPASATDAPGRTGGGHALPAGTSARARPVSVPARTADAATHARARGKGDNALAAATNAHARRAADNAAAAATNARARGADNAPSAATHTRARGAADTAPAATTHTRAHRAAGRGSPDPGGFYLEHRRRDLEGRRGQPRPQQAAGRACCLRARRGREPGSRWLLHTQVPPLADLSKEPLVPHGPRRPHLAPGVAGDPARRGPRRHFGRGIGPTRRGCETAAQSPR